MNETQLHKLPKLIYVHSQIAISNRKYIQNNHKIFNTKVKFQQNKKI